MPIRNPFKRGTTGLDTIEGIPRNSLENGNHGFQTTNVVGAKPIDIKEPVEYKLSGKTSFSVGNSSFLTAASLGSINAYF